MKKLTPNPLRFIPVAFGLVTCLLANNARAANYYWDINGATAGAGGATPSGTWENATWSTASAGNIATVNYAEGNFPRFAAGTDATGTYTITMNANHHCVGMIVEDQAVNNTITITGTGILTIDGTVAQGFITRGSDNLVINNAIDGTGGVSFSTSGGTGSGSLFLYGNNTYSGGTILATSGGLNFNNNSSLGTGPVTWGAVNTVVLACPAGPTGPITIANNFVNNNGAVAGTMITAFSQPVTFSGTWANQANLTVSVGNATFPSTQMIISSPISGSSSAIIKTGTGSLTLSGANTYAGATTVQNGIMSANSLNKVTGGTASSALGAPTTVANGTISIGATTTTGTLIYTGAGETTDRVLNLAGTTGGATLQADGSSALVFTAVNTATGAGSKTLTLQGSSTADNSIGTIVDNSAANQTSVVKAGAGTWVLAGANIFTGGTTVNAGTLKIGSGSVLGNVTNNNSSTLQLDSASALSASAILSVQSSGVVNLNYAGTLVINTLIIDGNPFYSGIWGSTTSGAPNQNALFTGNGLIQVVSPPIITQQPKSISAYPDSSYTFTVVAAGDPSFTYQWKLNGGPVLNATDASLLINPVETANAGTYVCWITNSVGWTNTINATLTILATNDYVNAVRASSPIAYWRLDETSGTLANDWIGLHTGNYINANLNQPGFSAVPGSDSCMGVPSNTAQKGYMVISNASPDFSFSASTPFTLEAWGMSTNFAAGVKQRIISYLTLTGNGGYGFGFPNNSTLEFTVGGVVDFDSTLTPPLASGVWYHFVVTFDGNNYVSYLNGNPVGSRGVSGAAILPPVGPMCVGNNPLTYPTEQLYGGIDEVAIYNYALDQTTVTNHYLARYTDAPLSVSAPVITPSTNYVSLSSTLTAVAAGTGLSYQWYHGAGTGTPVGTGASLTLSPLQLSDVGSYHVVVTDAGNHNADSPLAFLAVVAIPTSASQLNLTNGLVLHLPFDSDYKDISGRSNHGTAVGSPTLGASGAVGSGALHYGTTNGVSTNYVTVGVRPDLQFGDSTTGPDFTVSYWVRGTININLPFFCDAAGGQAGILALAGGFNFGPNTTGNGGWAYGMGSAAHESTSSGANIINDGNWHHLIHVAKRIGNMTTYLDGAQVDVHAIGFVSDSINTVNPANIGQDGSGAQVFADQGGDIDDMAVWTRALTSFEVSGIYLAGATNGVSFAPAALAATTITSISGTTLGYSGGAGSQFVLLSNNIVSAPLSTWTRVATNSSTPGSFIIPAVGSPSSTFYRVQSQ